jgi:hypothetical protein
LCDAMRGIFAQITFTRSERDDIIDVYGTSAAGTELCYKDLVDAVMGSGSAAPAPHAAEAFVASLSTKPLPSPRSSIGKAFDDMTMQLAKRVEGSLADGTIKSVADLFHDADASGDGVLSVAEFRSALRQLRIRADDVVDSVLLRHLDKDGNDSIELTEFVKCVNHGSRRLRLQEILDKLSAGMRARVYASFT